jgi:hypothetical protein
MITTFLQVQADTLSQVNPAELAKSLPVNTEISVLEFMDKQVSIRAIGVK